MEIDIKYGIEAVKRAAKLCTFVQENLISQDTLVKKDKSPVTVADFGAQAIVLHYLALEYPEIPVVAEESAGELLKAENAILKQQVIDYVQKVEPSLSEADIINAIERGGHDGGPKGIFWTLDPIDGTKGFIRKEQYAIALALIVDGTVTKGILGCPNLASSIGSKGSIFYAEQGSGSYELSLEDQPTAINIETSEIENASHSCFCESVESGHSSHSQSAEISKLLGIEKEPLRMDSQCKYAAISRGDADIYLRLPTIQGYEEKIWDHAAGKIIFEEAGGKIADVNGKPLDFSLGKTLKNNTGVVASSADIFDSVLQAVQKVLDV